MESDLVGLRRSVALALLRPDVDEHRSLLAKCPADRVLECPHVVARDNPDVGDAQILEQAARLLGELDDRCPEPLRENERRRPDEWQPFDQPVVYALALLPG